MTNRLRVGMDVAPLGDPALTGIPLYVESLLREFLAAPEEEWVLVGGPSAPDPAEALAKRGIVVPSPPLCQIVPAADIRLGSRVPAFAARPGVAWAARKLDGRALLPIGKFLTGRRVPPVDVFHHTAILRVPPNRARCNIVTIYDLSTRLFPEVHNSVNIAEWERVFAFAKNGADLVICDSESARDDVITHLGIEPNRVRAIPLGLRPLPIPTPERRQAVREQFRLHHQRFVLAVGSLDPRKNLPRLIEAFAKIAEEPDMADVRLVLTGARLHGTMGVDVAIATYHLEEKVSLTGYLSDEELVALMLECDCFAFPSLYEGFGLPVLEALSLGAPVVTSNVSALPEVAGDAALLVPPTDIKAIAVALQQVLVDPIFATELRRRGPLRAAAFSWERCAMLHRQAYREISET